MIARLIYLSVLSVYLLGATEEDAPAQPQAMLTCPAGAPLGVVDLRVRSKSGSDTLPLQSINHLSEGDTVIYSPVLRGSEKRNGEVALVLVPANRLADSDSMIVTTPGKADQTQEWAIPRTMSLAAFVYGPQGLNRKRVRGFLSQDDQLVAQLADYAEKTSQTEALLQALTDNDSSAASMNAALSGFASQYGLAVQIDKNAPAAAQAQVLFSTLNPQLATYNPMGSSSAAQRVGQTASVAAAAATLFFGSPIGLAAGGTAMLLDLRSIAFPGTQFRSSFAQDAKVGVHLCGQRGALPAHTRPAYIWALRIPNTPAPSIRIGPANSLPLGQKVTLPVEVPNLEWRYLQRARNWALEDAEGKRTPLKVLKIGNDRVLELDLQNATAGTYRLVGFWDWTRFAGDGQVQLRPLSDFKTAQVETNSQNGLLAHAGKIPVTLSGSDFEFAGKVELQKTGDEFATPETVRFLLPKGPRLGVQDKMDVQIDTAGLNAGDYHLVITQQDGVGHPVALRILPNAPRIDNLPVLVNQGVREQHYVLKGERLDLLAGLTAPNATIELGAASKQGNEREVTVKLAASPAPGTTLAMQEKLADRTATVELPDALQITGPLPVIASSRLSLPEDMDIALKANEFPAGYTLTAVLDVRNVDRKSEVRLGCTDDAGQGATMRVGMRTKEFSLQPLSADQLFLSYDTSGFAAGCTLEAVVDNGRAGKSKPFTVAHLIRLPQIASIVADATAASTTGIGPGTRYFKLTGNNLETIGRMGWDQTNGVDVSSLPAAIPGQGQTQSLTICLPEEPQTGAPLFVWLRGEQEARSTKVTGPVTGGGRVENHNSWRAFR